MGEGSGPGLSHRQLGDKGGEEGITLSPSQMPNQTYTADLSQVKGRIPFSEEDGSTNIPSLNMVFSKGIVKKGRDDGGNANIYSNTSSSTFKDISLSGQLSISNGGGSQEHNNMQPYLAVNYIIALQGIYPSRS